MERIVRTVVDAALVATLVAVLLVVYGLLDNRWYKILAIDGGSMAPALEAGDAAVLTRPPRAVAPGMVLTLQVGDELVTHRVVAVEPDGTLVTRGDANHTMEAWEPDEARVVGRVHLRVPWLGWVLRVVGG